MTPLARRMLKDLTRPKKRIRRGRLEYVREHWRGDAAIGIKRSRYRVIPPRKPPEDHPPSS